MQGLNNGHFRDNGAVCLDAITELWILSVRICCVISKHSGSEAEGRRIEIRAEAVFSLLQQF